MRSHRGFTLTEMLVVVAIVVVFCVGTGYAVTKEINKQARTHIVTVESFRAAGTALCMELYSGDSARYAACLKEVMEEFSRAISSQSAFNTAAVPSIPPAQWPSQ